MSSERRCYIVATPDSQHLGLPSERGELVAGFWQATLRALHIARVEQRSIAIYLWPECENARKREQGKRGDGRAIRHYSAGAPLVTIHNEQTIRKLAAHERLIDRAHTLKFLRHMLETCAYAARDGDFPDIAERMDMLQTDVDRTLGEFEPDLPAAEEGLQTKHWPREHHEALMSA